MYRHIWARIVIVPINAPIGPRDARKTSFEDVLTSKVKLSRVRFHFHRAAVPSEG